MAVSNTFQQLDKRKQKRIVSAALTEFAKRGYAGASINAIVEKVGIAKGSIFNYFTDKQGLFRFVFEQALEMVKGYLRTVRDESADDDVFARIEKSLLAGVAFIRAHPRIYNLYLRVQFESGLPGRTELLKSVRNYSIRYLSELLTTGQERGEIGPELDVEKAAFAVDAVLERFIQAYGVQYVDAGLGVFKADEDEVARWAAGLVELLRYGLSGERRT